MVLNRLWADGPRFDSRRLRLAAGGGTQRLRFPEGASCSPGVAHSWLECLCVVPLSLPMSCCYVSYLCLLLDIASNYFQWLSFIARAVLSLRRSRTIASTLVSEIFCGLAHHVGKRWLSFIARAVLSLGRSRANAKHTGFRGFLWVGSSRWEEVTLFHCKSCAFIRSKPRYCQTHWFQRFFVGWLIMLGRGDSLSLQELCFQ